MVLHGLALLVSAMVDRAVLAAGACPDVMVRVEGDYCPVVQQVCAKSADPATDRFAGLRCAEYAKPARCLAPREPLRVCVDREEYADERGGDAVPRVNVTFPEAEELCEERGARLCGEREWELACEGEALLPYPYGFVRDKTACNFDREDLGHPEDGLTDWRMPRSAYPRCVSPFGVHDLVGNVDEWTVRDGAALGAAPPSVLHGGWWLPGRNNCRAATYGHGLIYKGPQVGFRCCATPASTEAPARVLVSSAHRR